MKVGIGSERQMLLSKKLSKTIAAWHTLALFISFSDDS